MSLDFSLVREMRQNLNKLLEYLVDKEIQDTPWKGQAEKQWLDIGQEILLLLDELEKYTEFKISASFQPYDFFHYLLLHFETLEHKIGAIPPLVLQELRDWFDLFNQFEANLSTFLEPLRSQTCWEEDEELAAMRRSRGRRGRKSRHKEVNLQKRNSCLHNGAASGFLLRLWTSCPTNITIYIGQSPMKYLRFTKMN